jgi:DNA-binding NarL/FixJ family response regulator
MTKDSALIRILAVDDHPLLRAGVAALIRTQPDLAIVGEASSGREAIESFRSLRPDVTLMDLQMPDMEKAMPWPIEPSRPEPAPTS